MYLPPTIQKWSQNILEYRNAAILMAMASVSARVWATAVGDGAELLRSHRYTSSTNHESISGVNQDVSACFDAIRFKKRIYLNINEFAKTCI